MAWTGVWTYKIDGVHINLQGSGLITHIPELENEFDDDVVLVPVDGRAPAYIRNQPKEGIYTLMISAGAVDWATWQTRMNTLRALLTKGQHTLAVQARGMAAEKSTIVIVRGSMVAAKERAIVYPLLVTVPIVF
jgi:hypothetical protein